jgi:cytochrome P450
LHHRIAKQNTTLPSGGGPSGNDPIFVPKGSRATTCTYSIHRDRAVFGDDIESFRPDRWETIKPEPWEFTPFGYGARKCLGEDKARLEAAYALARFGRAFEQLLSRDDRGWKGESKLSVRNAHGVLVAFLA